MLDRFANPMGINPSNIGRRSAITLVLCSSIAGVGADSQCRDDFARSRIDEEEPLAGVCPVLGVAVAFTTATGNYRSDRRTHVENICARRIRVLLFSDIPIEMYAHSAGITVQAARWYRYKVHAGPWQVAHRWGRRLRRLLACCQRE